MNKQHHAGVSSFSLVECAAVHTSVVSLVLKAFLATIIFFLPSFPVIAKEPASIVLDTGRKPAAELYAFNAPLNPRKEYYYFKLDVSAVDQNINLLADFSDPFVFISGQFFLFDWFSPLRVEAIAASWQGQIPIAVDYSEALVSVEHPFTAHLYLDGEMPLDPFPLFFDGTLGFNVNPDGDNDALLDEQQIVGNGELDIDANLCGLSTIDFSVGPATISIDSEDGERIANVMGRLIPNTFPLDLELPIQLSDLMDSFAVSMQIHELDQNACVIDLSGSFTVDSSVLGTGLNVPLNDLIVTDGRLRIDQSGIRLIGNTSSQLHHLVLFENTMAADIFISNSNPTLNKASLTGSVIVGGVRLGSEATVEISPTKLDITGEFNTPIQAIALGGSVLNTGIQMSGSLDLDIPIYGPSLEPRQVTDGAICGYNQITSAAQCGADYVANLAVCGQTSITDRLRCGERSVTDGAICGYTSVCNFLNVCEPKTCKVANTCNVPATCWVPRTCNDLNSPLTCITSIEVITQQGSLDADMSIELSQSGLSGSLSGEYCYGDICLVQFTDAIQFGAQPIACAAISSRVGGCVLF